MLAVGYGANIPHGATHNTIDDISPEQGQITVGGSTEATVFLTSVSSCLEAEADEGLDVTFDPACGEGTWSSTMTVTDTGGTRPTGQVVIKEIDAGGSEVDRRTWEIQTLTTIPGPGPTTTTAPAPTSVPNTTEGAIPPPAATPPPPITIVPGEVPTTLTPNEEQIRLGFETSGIAFNTPARLGLEQTTKIHLVLGRGQSGEDVAASVTAPGDVESAEILTTCETTAQLRGQNFEVLELTPPTQFVCAGSVASWLWEVKALEPGIHSLTLTISALIGDNPPVTIRVYNRDIEIEVGLFTQIFGPVLENLGISIGAFAGAVGAAGGAWAWNRLRRRSLTEI